MLRLGIFDAKEQPAGERIPYFDGNIALADKGGSSSAHVVGNTREPDLIPEAGRNIQLGRHPEEAAALNLGNGFGRRLPDQHGLDFVVPDARHCAQEEVLHAAFRQEVNRQLVPLEQPLQPAGALIHGHFNFEVVLGHIGNS
ncbi:hypothetical protein D3C75_938060 [compost metagenome]